jgi:cell division protein FtsB
VFKFLEAMNRLLGTLLTLVILTLLGVGGWFGFRAYYAERGALQEARANLADRDAKIDQLNKQVQQRTAEIAALNRDLQAKQKEIDRLGAVVKLLKLSRRIAQLTVLGQDRSEDGKGLFTRLSFVEVSEEGKPIDKPRVFLIKGDVVYIDAWVVKFDLDYLEKGDPLRSTSICLFRSIFGQYQAPAEGFALDQVGSQPAAYRTGGKPSEFEQHIWSRFWDYANNPSLAKQAGIRAAHGEAPSIKLLPGKRYRIVLQAAGGLTIDPPENVPAGEAQAPKTAVH